MVEVPHLLILVIFLQVSNPRERGGWKPVGGFKEGVSVREGGGGCAKEGERRKSSEGFRG